jgi:glyceraldehyde 3-phosphate dehydrogenase|tara:strand:+ start:665 stop:1672 length:1008 start_codon:yes stop_codon:yes gene_type:complete
MTKIGINGFGRIGRLILRAILENYKGKIQVLGINDLGSVEANAHLIKYDSTHGTLNNEVKTSGNSFQIDDQNISVFSERDPAKLPWGKIGVDVVLECTGFFLDKSSAGKHLEAGAKKVIISAPAKEVDFTVVQGVNSKDLKKEHNVISNGSCTTNCLAPVAMVLENAFGIKYGYMTTIHSYTGDQKLLDTLHKDLRRARASGDAMIPTSTGAAKAMSLVLPSLKGKLDGTAIRVPTSNVSLIDFTFVPNIEEITVESINKVMSKAANGSLKGILATNSDLLVSKDFNHNPHSSTFDLTQTQVVKGKLCRVLSWYDNEWGFSNRMCDTAIQIAGLI